MRWRRMPSAQAVGAAMRNPVEKKQKHGAAQALPMARRHGELIARAVKAFGFNTTLAPVVDLALPESAEVMGSRPAGRDRG